MLYGLLSIGDVKWIFREDILVVKLYTIGIIDEQWFKIFYIYISISQRAIVHAPHFVPRYFWDLFISLHSFHVSSLLLSLENAEMAIAFSQRTPNCCQVENRLSSNTCINVYALHITNIVYIIEHVSGILSFESMALYLLYASLPIYLSYMD